MYFSGQFGEKEMDNFHAMIILDILRYTIWQARLNKKNISFNTLEIEVSDLLDTITVSNKKIKYNIINNGFFNVDGDRIVRGGQEDEHRP